MNFIFDLMSMLCSAVSKWPPNVLHQYIQENEAGLQTHHAPVDLRWQWPFFEWLDLTFPSVLIQPVVYLWNQRVGWRENQGALLDWNHCCLTSPCCFYSLSVEVSFGAFLFCVVFPLSAWIEACLPPFAAACFIWLVQTSFVSVWPEELDSSLWQQQPWPDSTGFTGEGCICVCV